MGVAELKTAVAERLEPLVGGEGFGWRVSTASFVRRSPGVVAQLVVRVERSRFREEYTLSCPLVVRHDDVEVAYHRIVGTERSQLDAGLSPAEIRRLVRGSQTVVSSWDRTETYPPLTMKQLIGTGDPVVDPRRIAARALPWLERHSDRAGLRSSLEWPSGIVGLDALEKRLALHLADGDREGARRLALQLLAEPPFTHADPAGLVAVCTRVVDETR
ncbi:hypothetical protein ACEXQD_00010 [Herbiconiux sp. P15]|uniref:hypothetical protein n=1 Tax=Herbiconiux liukaitaii TaxID=3342799 RepID=UPI0035B7E0D7